MFSAIILAAGLSKRMNGIQKQFVTLNNKLVLQYSVDAFLKAGADEIIIASNKNKINFLKNLIKNKKIKIIAGGKTRQESAYNAFWSCKSSAPLIVIHDAARPFITTSKIKKLINIANKTGAATLALFATDTVKLTKNNIVTKTIDRNTTALIQTPQAFSKKLYAKALDLCNANNNLTDDCQLIEKLNHPVFIVKGDKVNFKITTKYDLAIANFIAKKFFH